MRSLFCFALGAICLLPAAAQGAAITVSPITGTKTTHFILSASGWPSCGEGSTEQMGVAIDNHGVYSQNSVTPFSIDLATIDPPDHICAICTLPSGPHTIKVSGFSERGGTPSCTHEQLTLCLTFTIVDSATVGDPWLIRPFAPTAVGTPGDTFSFIPQGAVGFPQCDSVQLIQVMRETGHYVTNPPRFLTTREQVDLFPGLPRYARVWADSTDAWTTPAHYHIDLLPTAWRQPYVSVYPYSDAKVGRIGASPDTARFADSPKRGDVVFPDSVVKIALDIELNAFCAAGEGRGQYLGRCAWHWERTRGSPVKILGIVTFIQPDLGEPSAPFKEAVERYAARTGFPLPRPISPKKGGSPCQ